MQNETMTMAHRGRPILLLGSVPLADAETVFATVANAFGTAIARIPDGETGVRTNWVFWQRAVMAETPFLEERAAEADFGVPTASLFGIKGDLPTDAAFGHLRYADVAIASYATFCRARDAGTIAPGVRFQVSLPTPIAPLVSALFPQDIPRIAPLYAHAMEKEVARICAAIPGSDLAIQWDVAIEIAVLEGVTPMPIPPVPAVASQLAELAKWVPDAVSLGYHLCYGDAGHEHFKQPADTALMVELANALLASVERRIDWIHMPVPRSRNDAGYFAPLAGLNLPADCTLFLGLVHRTDGLPGAEARIRAAEAYVTGFGVATECGLGRRPPETVAEVIRLTADVSKIPLPVAQSELTNT